MSQDIFDLVKVHAFLLLWRALAIPGDLVGQLGLLWRHFGDYAAPDNKTRSKRSPRIGNYTKRARLRMLVLFIHELRKLGFHPLYLDNLTAAHVRVVLAEWIRRGCVVRTLQTRLAAIRMLFAWVGRSDALPSNAELLPPGHRRGTCVATRDQTWSGAGLDLALVLTWIPANLQWIRLALELMMAFGLRPREAAFLHPHEAIYENKLLIGWGPKGGRQRFVPIDTPAQRELLSRCQAHATPGESILGPRDQVTWRQGYKQFYYIMEKKLKITRKDAGATAYSLRRERFTTHYKERTGQNPPVLGGGPVPAALDRAVRQEIATLAGHNRASVSSAYLGGVLRRKKAKSEGNDPTTK